MKLTKSQLKEIKKAIELEFCKALHLSPQKVTDAMNTAPCYLGSEKYFENVLKSVQKSLASKGA